MKLFIDSANLSEIETALQGGFVCGITTNPSLLSKEPKASYYEHLKKIVDLANKYGGCYSLSIEVFTEDKNEIIKQAKQFINELRYPHIAIKVHVSYKNQDNYQVIKTLSKEGIAVNCTACMTPLQAAMAAAAGAKYVSLFCGRIRDGGQDLKFETARSKLLEEKVVEKSDFDPEQVIRETYELIKPYPNTEIIAGSMRSALDIKKSALAGAHIVTASLKLLSPAMFHFKTNEVIEQFFNDFQHWLN